MLDSFDQRHEESRDAARICLRLPLPTIGLSYDDFKEVAVLGQIADKSDSTEVVLSKLKGFYEKIREHEKEEDPQANQGMSAEQKVGLVVFKNVGALELNTWELDAHSRSFPPINVLKAADDANYLIDVTALEGGKWSAIRPELANIFREVGKRDMAAFVDPYSS